jgi:hypothetical protein
VEAIWRAALRVFPGPAVLAAWIAVTVPIPLVFYEATHRWEQDQPVSTALWWPVAAVPVLATVLAARWTSHAQRRRTVTAFMAAVAAGTVVSAVLFGLSLVVYRTVIPLGGEISWSRVTWRGLSLAVPGAAIGYLVGLLGWPGGRRPGRGPYLVGVLVAVAGAILAPVTVRLGAEDSTGRFDQGAFGGVGPYVAPATAGEVRLPAGGRYAVMAVGFAPDDPDCHVAGPGVARRHAKLVTIPPGDYGSDAASYAWVASFSVPAAGIYSLTCRTHDEEASYVVVNVPPIRGAVGSMIHWPLGVIWLLGSIPGLLIFANTIWRPSTRHQPAAQ